MTLVYKPQALSIWDFYQNGKEPRDDLLKVILDDGSCIFITRVGNEAFADLGLLPLRLRTLMDAYPNEVVKVQVVRDDNQGNSQLNGYVGHQLHLMLATRDDIKGYIQTLHRVADIQVTTRALAEPFRRFMIQSV